jgi:hypothetical protein
MTPTSALPIILHPDARIMEMIKKSNHLLRLRRLFLLMRYLLLQKLVK